MMRSSAYVWLVFGICLLSIVAAVGWLSQRAVESENAEALARQQATVEENARLALWRIDSALAPLVTQESSRPAFAYETFYQPPERGPVGGGGKTAKPVKAVAPEPEPIVSPLVMQLPPQILLHFEFDAAGHFSSPRVPPPTAGKRIAPDVLSPADIAAANKLLDRLKKTVDPAQLLATLPAAEATVTDVVPMSGGGAGSVLVANGGINGQTEAANQTLANNSVNSGYQIGAFNRRGANYDIANNSAQPQSRQAIQQPVQQPAQPQQQAAPNPAFAANVQPMAQGPQQQEQMDVQQKARNDNEFFARQQYLAQNMANAPPNFDEPPGVNASEPRSAMMTPLWLHDQLVLVRRVHLPGGDKVQGCLLDWPTIEQQLLDVVADLVPRAKLVAATANNDELQSRRSAVLPIRLELAEQPALALASLSPVRMSLVVAWSSLLLGAAAVAMLLRGVMLLSERRASFVSAVTHELRTPLTTFRMYAEMLHEGMVPDELSRRKYLETLRVEADRLTHLVENVLAYSRLERGGPGKRIAPVALGELLTPASSRLRDRAEQAGFELQVSADEALAERSVLADPGAVEQILFNLVDNACKYAQGTGDRVLHVTAESRGPNCFLRVRDHGPGIDAARRRLLFQAFRKSAHEAAVTAPGVGLGLALCRRLARDMGGDLCYEPAPGGGACFVLRLKAL